MAPKLIIWRRFDPLLKNVTASESAKRIKAPIVADNILEHEESASIVMHDNAAVIYFNTNHTILRRNINLQGLATGKAAPAFCAPLKDTELGLFKAVFSTVHL